MLPQRNLGVEVLSITYQSYPRIVRHIGERQFRELSMICPVVAEMVLFSDVNMNMYHLDSSEDTAVWQLVANACEKRICLIICLLLILLWVDCQYCKIPHIICNSGCS